MFEPDVLKLKEEPIPYKIRIRSSNSFSHKTPPQWLLLDHTIAVLWILYNSGKGKDNLDIEQLKWAHVFLKGIRSAEKKENLPEIKNCITDIEDRLIAQYAGLTMYSRREIIGGEDSSLEVTILSKTDPELLKSIKADGEKEVKKDEAPKKYIKKTEPLRKFKPIEIKQSKRSEAAFNEYIERLLEKRTANNLYWNSKLEEDKKTSKSVISSIPAPKTKKPKKIRFAAVNTNSNLCDLKKKKENCKSSDDVFSTLKAGFQCLTTNPEISNTELMDFLKQWRTEQVDKIQIELKRLGSIEELMKNINMEDFEPFMEAEVTEKLSKIKPT